MPLWEEDGDALAYADRSWGNAPDLVEHTMFVAGEADRMRLQSAHRSRGLAGIGLSVEHLMPVPHVPQSFAVTLPSWREDLSWHAALVEPE